MSASRLRLVAAERGAGADGMGAATGRATGPDDDPRWSPTGMTIPAAARSTLHELMSSTGLPAVVCGVSKDPNAKLTALLVAAGGQGPGLVAKIATTVAADTAVRREYELLRSLRAEVAADIADTVPRPLDLFEVGGRSAMLASVVPGTPMLTTYQRRRHTANPAAVTADLTAALRWLGRFQQPVAVGPAVPPWVRPDDLADRFRNAPDLDTVVARLRRAADRLGAMPRRVTPVHGDLWLGNVLLTGVQVSGVVDWEAGAVAGDPVRDVVRFATAYALYLDRRTGRGRSVAGHAGLRAGTWGAGVAYAVDGAGWFPALFRGFVRAGLEQVGVAAGRWLDAIVLGVAEAAMLADHDEFAGHQLALLASLCQRVRPDEAEGRT
jgi:aminoglycoside phosphotransferase